MSQGADKIQTQTQPIQEYKFADPKLDPPARVKILAQKENKTKNKKVVKTRNI